ncbi:choline/ethanolamine transporter flvcr2b-like, partial [Spinachia spinachia]
MNSWDEFSDEWMDGVGQDRDKGWSPKRKEKKRRQLSQGDSTDASEPSDATRLLPPTETKLYKRRWVMLFIFSAFSASNGLMWLQCGIISDILLRFYGIDALAIDWLSMVFLLTYIALFVPATWVLNNRGVRVVVVAAAAFNCIGAWIKTGTADPDMFAMTFFGQFVCSVATIYIGIPSRLASLWFGEREVSTACSIAVLGTQVCVCVHFWAEYIFGRLALGEPFELVSCGEKRELFCVGLWVKIGWAGRGDWVWLSHSKMRAE